MEDKIKKFKMDKKTVNQQIINGLASKGINIAEIELNHLEAFADIMYKAINEALTIPIVVGQSELLCDHPRSERSYIGQNMLRCNKCGKEFS